eukprot:gb/GECG01009173.1/.p1 GENE.gb/GECG01009173.1/~~gb/GECG01009173.1/.p1  ORF type:complete len:311 (+),score=48.66 gb/GECG01009173.1/:1-933(+)
MAEGAPSPATLSLLEWAHRIMTTPDPHEKASLSYQASDEWTEGRIATAPRSTGGTSEEGELDRQTLRAIYPPPNEPSRPDYVEHVDPRRVKSGSKKALIHAVTHAESYAIDLSWDLILRFAFSNVRKDSDNDGLKDVDDISEEDIMPKEFFDDWVKVAMEEAKHFRKWAKRLRELGSKYGELPGHGGLWESATDTADSLTARLSVVHMVHEARGLDVYPGMLQKLQRSDDTTSCEILEQNHKEEITHVAAGKRWLSYMADRTSKDPIALFQQTVRSRFRGALKPPFNEEKREAAGLTREWYMPLAEEEKE